jgi:hypothetical protein
LDLPSGFSSCPGMLYAIPGSSLMLLPSNVCQRVQIINLLYIVKLSTSCCFPFFRSILLSTIFQNSLSCNGH